MSSPLGDKKGRVASSSDLTRLRRKESEIAAYGTYTGLSVTKKMQAQQGTTSGVMSVRTGAITLVGASTTGRTINPVSLSQVFAPYRPIKTFPRLPASLSSALSASLPSYGTGSIFIAVGSDGSFYLSVFNISKFYRVSPAPDYTITDITTGSGISNPTCLVTARDGNIFFVNAGNGSIYKYNITTGVTSALIAPGSTYQCYGMTEGPDGTIYASNRSSSSIQVFPSTGWSGGVGTKLVTLTGGLRGIVYANDGFLYVYMDGSGLYKVNPVTGGYTLFMVLPVTLISTLSQGPDGYIYGTSGSNIYTIDIVNRTYLVTSLLPAMTSHRFGPDGTLYLSDNTGKIYKVLSYNASYSIYI